MSRASVLSELSDLLQAQGRLFPAESPAVDLFRCGGKDLGMCERPSVVPAMTRRRDGDDLVVSVDVPGVPVEDVHVSVVRNRLTISGERKAPEGDDVEGDVMFGAFERVMVLPRRVEQDSVDASFDAGVLTVRVTGVFAEEPAQEITIRTA